MPLASRPDSAQCYGDLDHSSAGTKDAVNGLLLGKSPDVDSGFNFYLYLSVLKVVVVMQCIVTM